MQALAEFKAELRQRDLADDPWGTAMGAFFDVAEELERRGGDQPTEWQYRSGANGPPEADENTMYDITEASTELLYSLGDLLYRYTNLCKYHGRDY